MKVKNPRTGRILQNPEKFIRTLQEDLSAARRSRDHYKLKLRGEVITFWNSYSAQQRICSSCALIGLNVGDKVAIIGKVTSVKASKCQAGNKESEFEYEVQETRRLPNWF